MMLINCQVVSASVCFFSLFLVTSDMVLSYEEKVIIKYIRIKYDGAARIANDHPEYEWNVNGVKKLLKKIEEACDVARKEGSEGPKSVRTEENFKLVVEMILRQEDYPRTHSTPTEIARELNTDYIS